MLQKQRGMLYDRPPIFSLLNETHMDQGVSTSSREEDVLVASCLFFIPFFFGFSNFSR